jgi:hypothetical protein
MDLDYSQIVVNRFFGSVLVVADLSVEPARMGRGEAADDFSVLTRQTGKSVGP